MEQMSDFTDIKLPTIYYHLEKMEAAGLITAENVKDSVRPEKKVYSISSSGCERFQTLLGKILKMEYRPTFEVDGALYFSDHLKEDVFLKALEQYEVDLKNSLDRIEEHRRILNEIPEEMQVAADLIFLHHRMHYQAELTWAQEAKSRFQKID